MSRGRFSLLIRDAVSEAGVNLEYRGTLGMSAGVGYPSGKRFSEMVRPPDHALPYAVYGVSRRHRQPLLQFIQDALAASGCRIIQSSDADHAPFRISFETSTGERMGILAYAFFANNRATKNRPKDEYRFQLKYGGKLQRNVHEIWQDPYGLYTTLLVGISPEQRFFVGYDPVLHNPTKHFISLEFKTSFVEEIFEKHWAWRERERKRGVHEPVEVIVGGTMERFLDFVRFEREAVGEDQGHRAFLADHRGDLIPPSPGLAPRVAPPADYVHQLSREFEMSPTEVLDLIAKTARLKMAVRGWVAEEHLVHQLERVEGVSDCVRILEDNRPDIQLRFEGSDLLLVECKNVLRKPRPDGTARVDFQRTRASKRDECSRYYSADDFDILAACLHALSERWEYSFALTRSLDKHRTCAGKLSSYVNVDSRWQTDIRGILGAAARAK